MGRVGSCFDNAAAEAFFSTLEHEVLSRHHFTTKAHARQVVVRLVPRLLQPPTPTQLRCIDVADPIRETRCRPTGRSIKEASTIPGEAHTPLDRSPQAQATKHMPRRAGREAPLGIRRPKSRS